MPKAKTPETTPQRLSSTVKSVRDIMRKDKGLNGDGDRLPMLTWMMFLKFLDDLERTHEAVAEIEGRAYRSVISEPYRWRDWASPTTQTLFEKKYIPPTGDDLIAFINNDEVTRPDGTRGPGLFAHLRALQGENPNDRRNVIATIFKGTLNRMTSGYLMREVLEKLDQLDFTSSGEVHTLSQLYEGLLKEMRDASGDAGEFYTPRAVVKFMVTALDPKLGETILDPACGTGGFLVEALEHMKPQASNTEDLETLGHSILGGEAKPLPYLLAQMNLILHGLEVAQIKYGNSLDVDLAQITDKDRVDIILANPPFGGEEHKDIQKNYPADKRTSETALLFLQVIMRRLRRKIATNPNSHGGRAGVVVPNGVLFAEGVAGRSNKNCSRSSTFTPSCACRTGCSRRTRASRRTWCSSTDPAQPRTFGTTSSPYRRARRTTRRRSRSSSRSSRRCWRGGAGRPERTARRTSAPGRWT